MDLAGSAPKLAVGREKWANALYSRGNFVPVWIWPWPRPDLAADLPLDPAGRSRSRLTCGKCMGICRDGSFVDPAWSSPDPPRESCRERVSRGNCNEKRPPSGGLAGGRIWIRKFLLCRWRTSGLGPLAYPSAARRNQACCRSVRRRGGYLVWDYIPKSAAPVKPELYPSSHRGCLLTLRRLNRFSFRAGLRITEPSGWRSCSRGRPRCQGLTSYQFQQVHACPDDALNVTAPSPPARRSLRAR